LNGARGSGGTDASADRIASRTRRGWFRGLGTLLAALGTVATARAARAGPATAGVPPTSAGTSGARRPADVRAFGAVGDGIVDDTAAIQAAIDAASSVRVPSGTYRVGRLRLRSDLVLSGDGASSVLQGRAGTTLLHALSPAGGRHVENVELRGLRLEGAVTTHGFSEHVHLLSANGVRNLLVDGVQFVGFQGDGLYLGAHLDNSRSNLDVRVVNCLFDGVNKDNRNCISVIDGDTVTIRNCVFRRSTRSDMPGFIDVEPNDASNVVRRIQVSGNHFEDTDGAVGAISVVVLKPVLKVPPHTFLITNNTFDIDIRMVSFRIDADYGAKHNLVISGNAGSVASLGDFYPRLRGAVIGHNTLSVKGPAAIGHGADAAIDDLAVVGNAFDGGGSARGAFDLRSGRGHTIGHNVFSDFASYGILCGSVKGMLSDTSIAANTFVRCGAYAVASPGGIDGASCSFLGNTHACSHRFPAWINDDTGGLVNGGSSPITFNGSTPTAAFVRQGVHRSAIDGDRAVPSAGGHRGVLETRVEGGRNGAKWRLQLFYPAPGGPDETPAFYSRRSGTSGPWSAWTRHVGLPLG
jgi:hypothetical protein